MTVEQQMSLKRELDGAIESGDANRISCAQSDILLAVMDCQCKLSTRVKKLQWKFTMAIFALGAGGGTVVSHWDIISRIVFGN